MQTRIFPILIISILLIAGVFGFFGLGSMDHKAMSNCPIFFMSGGNDCTSASNAITIAFHHVSGLQDLAQATVSPSASSLILSILLIFVYLVFSKLSHEAHPQQALSFQKYRKRLELGFTQREKIIRWFALQNKRDAHLVRWVYGGV